MDSELDLIDMIDQKLKRYELPEYSSYKDNIKEYLKLIEEQMINIIEIKKNCIDTYKKSKINVSSIVDRINISRATIYNNKEILEQYIVKNQEELEKNDLFKLLDERNEKIKSLNDTILKLQNRDLDEQFYLDKIQHLEKENKRLVDEKRKLDASNTGYTQLIEKLEQKVRKYELEYYSKNKILDYNKKDRNGGV